MIKRTIATIRFARKRLEEFIHHQQAVGWVIISATLLSLLFTNVIFRTEYLAFWQSEFHFATVHFSVEHFINDALMPLFFLLVGLEIKREILVGSLSNLRSAMLPVMGALGGMLLPALIFTAFNHGSETSNGWGIPMATDIAFALAILAILGDRVPLSLKILLTTLAVVDDLGAIVVIAVFYTQHLFWTYVALALLVWLFLFLINRVGGKHPLFFLVPGILLWYFIYKSGVHATIAGVLLAAVIPFDEKSEKNTLDSLVEKLHIPINFVVLPLFALCNTAIIVDVKSFSSLSSNLSLGIIVGLVLGKTVGIFSFVWAAVKFKISELPTDINFNQIVGMSMLGGIGFTMSIFISMLAFSDAAFIAQAKFYVMLGSLISGLLGFLLLSGKKHPAKNSG